MMSKRMRHVLVLGKCSGATLTFMLVELSTAAAEPADAAISSLLPELYCVEPGTEGPLVTGGCDHGAWPDGRIPYVFDPAFAGDKAAIRAGMDEWEFHSDHVIRFDPNVTAADTVKAVITDCNANGGQSPGFTKCQANPASCNVLLCDNFRHELGHLIGLEHQHQRNDRNHYLKITNTYMQCPSDALRCSEPSRDNYLDLGPFNFTSVMLYPASHPNWVRWNDEPLCNALPPGTATCPYSVWNAVTARDGAAVIELYQATKYTGVPWTKFQRTVDWNVGGVEPLYDNFGIASGHAFPPDASPAIETWGTTSLAIYARATDGLIYKKAVMSDAVSWTTWSSVGAPAGAGSLSDPAVVSWGSGRSDLVVRRGGEVFITSTPIWGQWQGLDAPPSAADSAPAIASIGPNHLIIFVRSVDDQVYVKECTADCVGNAGTWGAWTVVANGQVRGKVAATSRGDVVNVAAQGANARLLLAEFSPTRPPTGWGDPQSPIVMAFDAQCPDCSSPAISSRSLDSLDFYVRGQDDKAWFASLEIEANGSGIWSTRPLGAVITTSPATVSRFRADARADLVVMMLEEVEIGRPVGGTWWKRLQL